jgi:hypothetical protein
MKVALISKNVTIPDIIMSSSDTPGKLKIDEIILRNFDHESEVPIFLMVPLDEIVAGLLFIYPQLLIHDAKPQRTLQYSARKNGI